jgi:hypothetical protein
MSVADSLDIDTPWDLSVAELMMNGGLAGVNH